MNPLLLILAAAVPAEKPAEKRAGHPADAVALALADVAGPGATPAAYRYVWVPTNDPLDCAAVDAAVATAVSRSTVLVRGARLGGNRLLRYDLRLLAPQDADLKTLTETWERFEGDEPYFLVNGLSPSIVLFKDVVIIQTDNAKATTAAKVLATLARGAEFDLVEETVDNNGEWYKITYEGQEAFVERRHAKKESRKLEQNARKPARTLGPHLGAEAAALVEACGTQVPIVRHDYFIRKTLSTLDGGLYYEFRGIAASPDEGTSDLDHFLQTFGGVKIATVEELRSDQKAALFRSGVTGKPRATLFFTGTQGRVTTNQGLIVMTQDMRDADVDAAADPVANLIRHKFVGIELFLEMPNGMLAYALFTGDLNGDGKFDPAAKEGDLVRSVPDDIATDHSVPAPHTGRLQPAISCMRCHNMPRGEHKPEGWIQHPNDIQTLLASGLDVFGERTDGQPKQDTIDRGAGLYTGDLEKALGRARDDYAEAMLRLTGNPGDATDSGLTLTLGRITQTYHAYWYDMVTPETACRELGLGLAQGADGAAKLREVLPPLPPDEIGTSPEDLRLGALKAGLALNRFQWEAAYADAAYRVLHTLVENQK